MMMLCASTLRTLHSIRTLILHITADAVVANTFTVIKFGTCSDSIFIESHHVTVVDQVCEYLFSNFQMSEQTNERTKWQRGDKHFALSILMSHNCIYDEVSQILGLPLNSIINFVVYGCVFEI